MIVSKDLSIFRLSIYLIPPPHNFAVIINTTIEI